MSEANVGEDPAFDDLQRSVLTEDAKRHCEFQRLHNRFLLHEQQPRPLPPIPVTNEHEERSANNCDSTLNISMAGNNNNAFPALDTSFNNRPPSLTAGSQVNGNAMNNNANYMAPLPVGHQQDLNFLYAQMQELSTILQNNRDKVNGITRSAEEVARRANTSNETSAESNDHESSQARIRQLEHELAKSNKIIDLYKHEQKENTLLIAQYEEAMGTATDQIRNYCNDIDGRFLSQRRHYNNLLQAERDEHLQSRLDRDYWHAQTLRVSEMIRTAYRLRCDEWNDEFRIIRGLQEEVRCLRRCLGMEAEKPEEETGWPYLKEIQSEMHRTHSS